MTDEARFYTVKVERKLIDADGVETYVALGEVVGLTQREQFEVSKALEEVVQGCYAVKVSYLSRVSYEEKSKQSKEPTDG